MAGGFPVHGALYCICIASYRSGISDKSPGGLIVKCLDREGTIAFYCPASLGSAFLSDAGFINIVIPSTTCLPIA